jgi:hypothetical protein
LETLRSQSAENQAEITKLNGELAAVGEENKKMEGLITAIAAAFRARFPHSEG